MKVGDMVRHNEVPRKEWGEDFPWPESGMIVRVHAPAPGQMGHCVDVLWSDETLDAEHISELELIK
tara:strand:- start:282 stop:479 length:198 start_codon:yes stop_codon:yes gene_type:complete